MALKCSNRFVLIIVNNWCSFKISSLNLWIRPCDTVRLASLFACADQFSARSSHLIATICSSSYRGPHHCLFMSSFSTSQTALTHSLSRLVHTNYCLVTVPKYMAKTVHFYTLQTTHSTVTHTLISGVLYSRVTADNWNWRELQHLCDKPGHGVTNHQGYCGSAYWWHIPGMLGTLS